MKNYARSIAAFTMLAAILLVSTATATAKAAKNKKEYYQDTLGKINTTGAPVTGTVYSFRKYIKNMDILPGNNAVALQMKSLGAVAAEDNTGDLVIYDLQNKKVNWTKRINLYTSVVRLHDNILTYGQNNRLNGLDVQTGESEWQSRVVLYHVVKGTNIGIGYKTSGGGMSKTEVVGIDLTNGATLWEREIGRKFGWNEIVELNDTTLVIMADGLHTLNVNTGSGRDYETKTGSMFHGKALAGAAIAGAAGGALGGAIFASVYAGNDYVTGLVSNIVVRGKHIFFASDAEVACVDINGKLVWTMPLDKKTGCAAHIFLRDNKLFVTGKGYALNGTTKVRFGKAYFAAYDANTGKQLFNTPLKPDGYINDVKPVNNGVLLLTGNSVIKCNLADGKIITEKEFKEEPLSFTSNTGYVNNKSGYTKIDDMLGGALGIMFRDATITLCDHELNSIADYSFKNYYVNQITHNGYRFLMSEDSTAVINAENVELAKLKGVKHAVLKGNKLYDFDNEYFYEIDLSDIMHKTY